MLLSAHPHPGEGGGGGEGLRVLDLTQEHNSKLGLILERLSFTFTANVNLYHVTEFPP